MTQITIQADPDLVQLANSLAQARGTTVSEMVHQIIRALAAPLPSVTEETSPLTCKATGLLRLPGEKSDRDLIAEAVAEKHLK
jgi:hypothetical protein